MRYSRWSLKESDTTEAFQHALRHIRSRTERLDHLALEMPLPQSQRAFSASAFMPISILLDCFR